MACKYITDRLKGKGNVVIINGPPVSAVQNRVEGCQTEFKRHPDIKVLSHNQNAKGSREGGLEITDRAAGGESEDRRRIRH